MSEACSTGSEAQSSNNNAPGQPVEPASTAAFAEIESQPPEREEAYIKAIAEAAGTVHWVGSMPRTSGLLAIHQSCPFREEIAPEGESAYEVLDVPAPEGEENPSLIVEEAVDGPNTWYASKKLVEEVYAPEESNPASEEYDLSGWEIVAVIQER